MQFRDMYDALHYLLDNTSIRFGSLNRQIVGIPTGTNCAPLAADLFFLFCYERDFMLSLSDNNQTGSIKALNPSSRYLDGLLYINNPYMEQMAGQIYLYPSELQLNNLQANS